MGMHEMCFSKDTIFPSWSRDGSCWAWTRCNMWRSAKEWSRYVASPNVESTLTYMISLWFVIHWFTMKVFCPFCLWISKPLSESHIVLVLHVVCCYFIFTLSSYRFFVVKFEIIWSWELIWALGSKVFWLWTNYFFSSSNHWWKNFKLRLLKTLKDKGALPSKSFDDEKDNRLDQVRNKKPVTLEEVLCMVIAQVG